MLFNSYQFLFLFLPVAVILYWHILRITGVMGSIAWLALCSYVFYLSGEVHYPWLLAFSITANFFIARAMNSADGVVRTFWIWFGVSINIVALAYFKYSNFGLSQIKALGAFNEVEWSVVLPVGISFYSFTQIAYLVDVYKRSAYESSFVPYSLFVGYFPHLIAGPILHHKEMLPQFLKPSVDGWRINTYPGIAMLAMGLGKKMLLADPCGGISSGIYDSSVPHSFFVAWIGAIAYSLQIYFDFSGYTDMAIGASRLLGINLPLNFNSPYQSRSIIEFWKRWHITLSRFLRDYLYIPLGGNRKGTMRRYINLFLTMLLGGIWHGAGWNFLLWGALHGSAQSIAHGWTDFRRSRRLPKLPTILSWPLTLLFVILAWVPFRAISLDRTVSMWRAMIGFQGFMLPGLGPLARFRGIFGGFEQVGFSVSDFTILIIAALLATCAPNSQSLLHQFSVGLDSPGYNAAGVKGRYAIDSRLVSVLFVGLLLGMSLRMIGGYSEFIYFRF